MSFLETPRFPESLRYGVVGGPGFQTSIVVVSSGAESRNADWDEARGVWDVSQAPRSKADNDTLIKFFRAMKGRAHGFRFKDFADYEVSGSEGFLVPLSPTTWQMYKVYVTGAMNDARRIRKPVSGTVAILGTGVYTVDYTTGIVTKTSGADPTGWTGEFDVPARFDIDQMRGEIMDKDIFQWQSVPIVEIRNP